MIVNVNGRDIRVEEPWQERSLLTFLREALDLTGAKAGCLKGACGTCTVLVNDKPVLSCKIPVRKTAGKKVLTIEGLALPDGTLHPLQQAFVDHGAVQCGYCTPGMILRSHGLLLEDSRPTRARIRKAISPNLCRCTGYQQIIDAVESAAAAYPQQQEKARKT